MEEEQYIDFSHCCASLCELDIKDEGMNTFNDFGISCSSSDSSNLDMPPLFDNYDYEEYCDENCLEIDETDPPMQMFHLPEQQDIVKVMLVHVMESSSTSVSHEINSCMGDIVELEDHADNLDPKSKLDVDVSIVLGPQQTEHSMCGLIREHPNRIHDVGLKKSFISNKLAENVESKSKDASLKFHDSLQEDATHKLIDFIGVNMFCLQISKMLIDIVNRIKKGETNFGLAKFIIMSRFLKSRLGRYSKYLFIWNGMNQLQANMSKEDLKQWKILSDFLQSMAQIRE